MHEAASVYLESVSTVRCNSSLTRPQDMDPASQLEQQQQGT